MTTDRTTRSALFAAALVLTIARAASAASLQQVSNWTGGVANLPSDVLMYVYVPDKVVANPPVLTLIHSCDSNASVVLGQAGGLKSAADQYGFIIVVPQSNPTSLRCWTTDSTQVWTRDKGGDSNAIKQMVVYALSKYQANADRVYVTGCSSGAMMTELLGAYPEIFKAGSSFAGMPGGCHGPNDNSSNATGYNGTCAGGPVNYTAQQWGDLVRAMDPGYTGHRPRLQLFHGSAGSDHQLLEHGGVRAAVHQSPEPQHQSDQDEHRIDLGDSSSHRAAVEQRLRVSGARRLRVDRRRSRPL